MVELGGEPYHDESSCTATRSEGFSRRRLSRGCKWGLKRFRWETQQGVNGSRHAEGAWNVSLEEKQKKRDAREKRGIRGWGMRVRAYTRTRYA